MRHGALRGVIARIAAEEQRDAFGHRFRIGASASSRRGAEDVPLKTLQLMPAAAGYTCT